VESGCPLSGALQRPVAAAVGVGDQSLGLDGYLVLRERLACEPQSPAERLEGVPRHRAELAVGDERRIETRLGTQIERALQRRHVVAAASEAQRSRHAGGDPLTLNATAASLFCRATRAVTLEPLTGAPAIA
jgi:hypothetical protein